MTLAFDSSVGEPGSLCQPFLPLPTPWATLLPAAPVCPVPTAHQTASYTVEASTVLLPCFPFPGTAFHSSGPSVHICRVSE